MKPNQEEVRVERYGHHGYRIVVGGGYSFEACASNKHLSFTVEDRDQRDQLLQILEDVLESVKNTVLEDQIIERLDEKLDKNIQHLVNKQVSSILDQHLKANKEQHSDN